MEDILSKVDFETSVVYNLKLKIDESFMFENVGEDTSVLDADGQTDDVLSNVRRTIKYSFPLDNKKIIKSIDIGTETEDENGDFFRNLSFEYYLVVDKEEEDEFSIEELHDEIEEEWVSGSAGCDITIEPYIQ